MTEHAITTIDEQKAQVPTVASPMTLLERALQAGASIETITALVTLKERMDANEARKAFDAAIADAKAEIPVIGKNRTVDFTSSKGRTNYRHEDLGEITRILTPILGRHGLSYRFRTTVDGGMVQVTCIVSHRDGHSEENTMSAGRDDSGNKNSIQAVGSTTTYLQRYTLKAALGLAASDDDDGRSTTVGDPVSDDQHKELLGLAEGVGADVEKFCAFLKVPSLGQLPGTRFNEAKRALEAKRRQAQ